MNRFTRLGGLVCAVAMAGLAVFAQHGVNRARSQEQGDALLYLPNEKLLNHFTGGMSSVIADLLWLECVQYVATEAQGDRGFTWLNQMADTVVKLDPHFVDAYRYGGMFLAALKADDDAGIDLINRGIVANPHAWQLPYEGAMVFLLNRGDQPGSKAVAARYISMAAAQETAPAFIRQLAEKLQGQFELSEVERDMWTKLLDSKDKLLREIAARKLAEMQLRETCAILNERRARFVEANGREPQSLRDLGLNAEEDRLGGRFFIGPDGGVRNTTLLDAEVESIRQHIEKGLNRYHDEKGVFPPALNVLVQEGFLPIIQEHPYPEGQWVYNPATGTVSSALG